MAGRWWRVGWRNLGRNRRRTVVTALGLGVGYFAVVFMIAWAEGVSTELVENATSLVSGQIEIHDVDYRPDRSLYETIGGREGADVEQILRTIEADPSVVAVAPRVYASGLVSSGEATSAGVLLGVEPDREVALTRFLDPLVAGRLPERGRNEAVVGDEMARQLALSTGDELVVVTSGADGSMANDLYTVSGIFRTGLVEFDASTLVMPIDDLQALVVLGPARIHEIAVSTEDPSQADVTATRIATVLGAPEQAMEVAPWTELSPVLAEYVALADAMYWIFIVLIFSVASFGIANTMLMATFERRREFAVMLALGASPRSVVGTVLCEAVAIGVIGLGLGTAVTLPLLVWFSAAPPDLGWLYGSITVEGVLLRPSLRVGTNVPAWTWTTVGLIVTALVSAVYPAIRAARVPPADTLSGL